MIIFLKTKRLCVNLYILSMELLPETLNMHQLFIVMCVFKSDMFYFIGSLMMEKDLSFEN